MAAGRRRTSPYAASLELSTSSSTSVDVRSWVVPDVVAVLTLELRGVGSERPVRDVDSGNIRGRGEDPFEVPRQSLPSDEVEPA